MQQWNFAKLAMARLDLAQVTMAKLESGAAFLIRNEEGPRRTGPRLIGGDRGAGPM